MLEKQITGKYLQDSIKGEPSETHRGNKCGFRATVKENKCKLSLEISHDLSCRIGTTISQSSISLYDNDHFICGLIQSILLLKISNIIKVALKQAENVIHNRKQPNNTRKEIYVIESHEKGIIFKHLNVFQSQLLRIYLKSGFSDIAILVTKIHIVLDL